jgi:site-specific DNA-methyltransferase (adenine-specific)/modification methylase
MNLALKPSCEWRITVITSPPYNMNLRIRNGQCCSRQIVKEFSSKYAHFDDNLRLLMFAKC